MPVDNGPPDPGAAAVPRPVVIDDLVGLWELRPRDAFRAALRRHLARALGGPGVRPAAPRPDATVPSVTCLSPWAARLAVDEIARHPRPGRWRVALADRSPAPDEGLVAHAADRGVALVPATGGHGAAVVLAAGSPAPADDPAPLLHEVRRNCAPDAVVVWSQSLTWPDRARRTRSGFTDLFAAVDVEVVGDASGRCGAWYVGSAWTSAVAAGAAS